MCKTVDKSVYIVYKGQKCIFVNIDKFDLDGLKNVVL